MRHILPIFLLFHRRQIINGGKMTKTIKILIAFAMCVLMLLMTSINVFAEVISTEDIDFGNESGEIMPLWDNIAACRIDITYNNGAGNATGSVTKKTGVTLLEGTIDIYENDNGEWIYIGSWSNSTTRNTLAVSADFDAIQGSEYKAEFTINAYRGTTVETHTMETTKTYS